MDLTDIGSCGLKAYGPDRHRIMLKMGLVTGDSSAMTGAVRKVLQELNRLVQFLQ
jgi:hypothetical protein